MELIDTQFEDIEEMKSVLGIYGFEKDICEAIEKNNKDDLIGNIYTLISNYKINIFLDKLKSTNPEIESKSKNTFSRAGVASKDHLFDNFAEFLKQDEYKKLNFNINEKSPSSFLFMFPKTQEETKACNEIKLNFSMDYFKAMKENFIANKINQEKEKVKEINQKYHNSKNNFNNKENHINREDRNTPLNNGTNNHNNNNNNGKLKGSNYKKNFNNSNSVYNNNNSNINSNSTNTQPKESVKTVDELFEEKPPENKSDFVEVIQVVQPNNNNNHYNNNNGWKRNNNGNANVNNHYNNNNNKGYENENYDYNDYNNANFYNNRKNSYPNQNNGGYNGTQVKFNKKKKY
jgi:hypothetical protein